MLCKTTLTLPKMLKSTLMPYETTGTSNTSGWAKVLVWRWFWCSGSATTTSSNRNCRRWQRTCFEWLMNCCCEGVQLDETGSDAGDDDEGGEDDYTVSSGGGFCEESFYQLKQGYDAQPQHQEHNNTFI